MSSRRYAACLVAALTSCPLAALAATNVLFILDSSGSMLERVDGAPKIVTAKRVLADTLRDLPSEARIGLMTYGHRRRRDCGDIELLAPIGTQQRSAIAQRVAGLQPKGETPIASALDRAADAFARFRGDHNMIVLVTDGAEECHGDPCAAARRLSAAGLDVQVNVVGFSLGTQQREAVECVAREGHGHYYDARDQASLVLALSEVRQEVQLAQAAPPQPAPAAPSPAVPPPAPLPTGPRINLLAEENGGQLLIAPSETWNRITQKDEEKFVNLSYSSTVCQSEILVGFRDEQPITFDSFEMFIPDTNPANVREFELLVGNEGMTGKFRLIGKFTTTNGRMMRSPYQPFRFPEVTARYLKVNVLSTWGNCIINGLRLTPWRVMGRLP